LGGLLEGLGFQQELFTEPGMDQELVVLHFDKDAGSVFVNLGGEVTFGVWVISEDPPG
jgi:hypothetical protein